MEFDVGLDKHHLEGLAAQPTTAILELIWNALDADAGVVEVSFASNPLDGIEEIRDVRVWAKTWGEIIEDADHRLKFVQEHLGYDPSAQQAFRYLRERHAEFVPLAVAEASPTGTEPAPSTDRAA